MLAVDASDELYLLVHPGILRHNQQRWLADPHRLLQVPDLHYCAHQRSPGHRDGFCIGSACRRDH